MSLHFHTNYDDYVTFRVNETQVDPWVVAEAITRTLRQCVTDEAAISRFKRDYLDIPAGTRGERRRKHPLYRIMATRVATEDEVKCKYEPLVKCGRVLGLKVSQVVDDVEFPICVINQCTTNPFRFIDELLMFPPADLSTDD